MPNRTFVLVLFLASLLMISMTQAQTDAPSVMSTTFHQSAGNRLVTGAGSFPDGIQQREVALPNTPSWGVAVAIDAQPAWIVTTEDGTAYQIAPDADPVMLAQLAPNQPPQVRVVDGALAITPTPPDASRLTHPHGLSEGRMLYVSGLGDLVLLGADGQEQDRLALNALPDARLVESSDGQIAVYTAATDIYPHAIMGDALEGGTLTVLAIEDDALRVRTTIPLPQGTVFEGLSPFWANVDADGTDDLVATLSNMQVGASLRVYAANGAILYDGDPIGQGARWRHQLAFGPFGPDGELLLVDVLTPHIGGQVEFFRPTAEGRLDLVDSLAGYTSHVIRSRNLDLAVAGDFNGDGTPEIVLPNQALTTIAGIQLVDGAAMVVWELPLPSPVVTNLAALPDADGNLALGMGLRNDTWLLWTSTE